MKCFNWKLVVALAAIGIGLYALAPRAAVAAAPVLMLAACPLCMLLMMRVMGSADSCKTKGVDEMNADGPARQADAVDAATSGLRQPQADASIDEWRGRG